MTIGYDNLPMLMQTILDIPMYEGIGVLAHDIARPPATALDHTMTLTHAPAWAAWPLSNLPILSFIPGHPDFMELAAAASTDLNFQAGAWSAVMWIFEDVAASRYLMCKGTNIVGWYWYVDANGAIHAVTSQGGPTQQDTFSGNGEVTVATWWMLGMTRLGANIALYKNGNPLAATAGVHVNPASAAALKFLVGIDNTEAGSPWDGYLWRPIVFGRQISALEMQQVFSMTRGIFGV